MHCTQWVGHYNFKPDDRHIPTARLQSMVQKKSTRTGVPLVIVESPAKARTIGGFLGGGYVIEASIGHIRDLPHGAKEIPEEFKEEDWAHLGVNVIEDFKPVYVIPAEKAKQVRKLKDVLKDASDLYLATDEDREGEAISWHLCEVLKPKVPVHRLVFHEITEEAIREALAPPTADRRGSGSRQETRRIIDRLYGYEVSPCCGGRFDRGSRPGGCKAWRCD